MSFDKPFTKNNLDEYLRELSKEFRKRNGNRARAEVILIGGASILINYGFREMTYDMDAIIHPTSSMKDAINHVGDRCGLPTGWLNADFVKTCSYTPRLIEYSKYYKTFSNVLQVRTVTAEHLIAMKLMAGRQYKNDLSDVVGILMEHKRRGAPIDMSMIRRASHELYGGYDKLPSVSRDFIEAVFKNKNLEACYTSYKQEEMANKDILLEIQNNGTKMLKGNNLDEILRAARVQKEGEFSDA